MVFIPQQDQRTRAPSVRGDVGAAGAIGRAVQQAGSVAGQIANKWRDERDSATMTKSQFELSEWANSEINRINSLKGYEAEGAAKKFSDDYRNKAAQIADQTGSSRVKDAFTSWSDESRLEAWSGVAGYERNQLKDAATATVNLRYQQIAKFAENGGSRESALEQAAANSVESVNSGIALPAEAQFRLNREADAINMSAFKFEYAQNPEAAIRNMHKSGLSEVQQRAAAEQFSNDQWKNFQRQNTAEKIAEERRKKAEQDRQNSVMSKGFELKDAGQLTPQWYDANSEVMAPADSLYFGRAVGRLAPSGDIDNSSVVNNLNKLASEGKQEELFSTARAQYASGNISTRTYETYLSGKMTFDTAMAKEGADHIKSMLRVSDMNPDPAAPQRQANALLEWNRWARDNPNATNEQSRKAYQQISSRFVLTDTSESMLTMELPVGIGSRSKVTIEDIDTAEDNLADSFFNQGIAEPEFKRQSELLSRWREAVIKRQEVMRERGANAE